MSASLRLAVTAAIVSTFSSHVLAQEPFYKGALHFQPAIANSKCLHSQQGNQNGSPVVLAECNGSADQNFTFNNGTIQAYNGGKCLDVVNGSNVDGVQLQLWDCGNANPNQLWWWTGDNHLSWRDHGKCLDLPSGSTADNTRVQLWSCSSGNPNQHWNTGYWSGSLPTTSQVGQTGINNCGTTGSNNALCQTLWLNSVDDFCLWGPPTVDTIGNSERETVAYCTKNTHGARVMPAGTLTGVHFIKTSEYIQITGTGDFTKINIAPGDDGGELDNHGADGNGNPIGGLVYSNVFGAGQQLYEWTNFMSATDFCIRACLGPDGPVQCNHIYDVMGCWWNMPASYDTGEFESCDADVGEPMGLYGSSRWYQGVSPTPSAHPAPSSSNCVSTATVGPAKRAVDGEVYAREALETAAPMARDL